MMGLTATVYLLTMVYHSKGDQPMTLTEQRIIHRVIRESEYAPVRGVLRTLYLWILRNWLDNIERRQHDQTIN